MNYTVVLGLRSSASNSCKLLLEAGFEVPRLQPPFETSHSLRLSDAVMWIRRLARQEHDGDLNQRASRSNQLADVVGIGSTGKAWKERRNAMTSGGIP